MTTRTTKLGSLNFKITLLILASIMLWASFVFGSPLPYTANNILEIPQKEQTLKEELLNTAKQFLTTLEQGDVSGFSEMISTKGVVIGHEPPPIARNEVLKQLKNREGAYCVLFDTCCLKKEWDSGSENNSRNLRSYQEVLQKASNRKMKVFVRWSSDSIFGSTWSGQLTVQLDTTNKTDSWLGDTLDFGFIYENDSWKLMAVTYL